MGIDAGGLISDKEVHTTLAFVHTYPDGDRDFSFYRSPGADMMLRKEEVACDKIRESRIFHFGSLSFTHPGVREASIYAIRCAKEAGAWISFDPNLRKPLWNDLADAKKAIEYGMGCCDILKISDNELMFMTGETDYDKGALFLQDKYKIPLLCDNPWKRGSRAYYKGMKVTGKPFLQENTIETTGRRGYIYRMYAEYGSGEGALLSHKGRYPPDAFICQWGSILITTRRGALKVMPGKEEIEDLLGYTKE